MNKRKRILYPLESQRKFKLVSALTLLSLVFSPFANVLPFLPKVQTSHAANIDITEDLLFGVNFNNSTTDYVGNVVPTGTVNGYADLGDGNYAAIFNRAQETGLTYNVDNIENKLGGANSFTVATRVMYSSITSGQYNVIGGRWMNSVNNRQFLISQHTGASGCGTNGVLCAVLSANGTAASGTPRFASSVTTGEWYDLILVYDGTQTQVYHNGELKNTAPGVLYQPTSTPLELGWFNQNAASRLTGQIDSFHIWEGAADSDDIISIMSFLDSDQIPDGNYTLSYTAGANGSLSGSINQTVEESEDGTAVTAVPDEGYKFMNWSDGSTDNPRTDLNVTTNISARANFGKLTALDSDPLFLEDAGYDYLFKTDFNQNLTDTARSATPTVSSHEGYSPLNDGGYAVNVSRTTPSIISYNTAGSLHSGVYDSNGFTFITRYRLDSLNTGGYVGSVAGIYHNDPNERSWVLAHNNTSNASTFSITQNGNTAIHTAGAVSNINSKYGDWITVVATYDGTGQIRTYYDGNPVSIFNSSIYTVADTVPLSIGGFFNGSMSGAIDYVYVLDRAMTTEDVAAFFVTEDNPAPEDINLENQIFVNSDGLNISYDVYYNTGNTGPIVLMADSWGSNKDSYRADVQYMRDNFDFIGVSLNTRGKGSSTGAMDAIGYECKDIYELARHIEQSLSSYYNPTEGIHIMGYSAGGGKALLCSGKYPDYFTSVYATGSVANLTRWYETINTASYPADRPEIRTRTGNSVNPGVVRYHPAGFPSEGGSIENQEAFDARNGSLIGAYNTLSSVYLSHNNNDPRVNIQLSQDYDDNWDAFGKTADYQFVTCIAAVHSRCNPTEGRAFINDHKGTLTSPTSGDFLIGGWVESKLFKVEFLDDVGYLGAVDYEFNGDEFELAINTLTYEGPTEVGIKNFSADTLFLYDNDQLIAEIDNGVLVDSDDDYDVTLAGGVLTLTIPTFEGSGHVITGLSEPMNGGSGIDPSSLILHMDFTDITDLTNNQTVSLQNTDHRVTNGLCGNGNTCYNVGFADNGIDLGAPLLTDNNNWTIAFRGYMSANSQTWQSFISQYLTNDSGRFVLGKSNSINGNGTGFRIGAETHFTNSYTANSWQNWVFSKNGNTYTLTVDGVQLLNLIDATPLQIDNTIVGIKTTVVDEAFIDDLLIFDDAFSYNEVQNYIASITPQDAPGCTDPLATNYDEDATTDDGSCTYPSIDPSSLLVWMDFTDIVDLTGNQTVSLAGNDNRVTNGICGPDNTCYNTGNTNHGVDLGAQLLTDNANWTIAFDGYIPNSSAGNNTSFVSQFTAATEGRFFVGKNTANNTGFRIGGNANFYTPYTPNTWQHWVLSKNGNNYILTIDGVEQLNMNDSSALQTVNTVVGLTGTTIATSYIDNLFIFDDAYPYTMTRAFIDDVPETPQINLTSPTNYKLHQRDSNDQAVITIEGTVTNVDDPVSLEARFNGSNWITIANDISGPFSYNYTANTGMGDLTVRVVDQPDISRTVTTGVGDIYLLVGQSNQDGRADNLNSAIPSNGTYGVMFQQANRCTYYQTGNPVLGSWKINNDPTGNGNSGGCGNYGSQWPLVGNSLIAEHNVPIAWIAATYGGSGIDAWQKGQVHYDRALQLVNQATDGANIIKGILWHQGENDRNQTQNWYYTRLSNMIDSFKDDIQFEKVLLGIVSLNVDSYGDHGLGNGVQRAMHQAIAEIDQVHLGPELYDIPQSIDDLHYKTPSEVSELARRWTLHISKEFYNEDITYPELLSWHKYSDEVIAVVSNQPLEISNYLHTIGPKAFGFRIDNDGSEITNYTTSLVFEDDKNLILIDIGEEIIENNLTITYGETDSGYNTDVLRSTTSKLSVTRNYELEYQAPTYTLSFNTQGGSIVADITDLEEDDITTLPAAPTRAGHTFQNWNTQSDGSGTSYLAEASFSMPGANTTLYAIWEEVIVIPVLGCTDPNAQNYDEDATEDDGSCQYLQPSVSTGVASSVTKTSATLSGSIASTGGINSTIRGFHYGLNNSYGQTVQLSGSFSTGGFNLSVSSLTCGTTYHFRAFATNIEGTATGTDQTFTTNPCSTGGGGGGVTIINITPSSNNNTTTTPENNSDQSSQSESSDDSSSEQNSENQSSSVSFHDVSDSHWAKNYIQELHENCGVLGYADSNGNLLNLFGPNKPITRAELIKMVLGCQFQEIPSNLENTFSDVEPGQWYTNYITYAAHLGLIQGYDDGTFRPNNPVSRAEALKIILLSQFSEDEIIGGQISFNDVDINDWYAKYLSFAVSQGYVQGYVDPNGTPTGQFGPQKSITRAESAKVISKPGFTRNVLLKNYQFTR